jgi:hypothetical protein
MTNKIRLKFVEKKGGAGSGHFGHAGRPGKVGGSSSGKFSDSELENEHKIAFEFASKYGATTGLYEEPHTIRWHESPKSWIELHPKKIHNFKRRIVDEFGADYNKISDIIAMEFGRGLLTAEETKKTLGL